MENENQSRPELLQLADALAHEKNITRDDVLEAMEVAISKAGRSKFGPEYDVRVHIDRRNGAIDMARYMEVVEEVENEFTQLTLEQARQKEPAIKLGEFVIDPLPPMDFGRIAAQTAKQVIVQKVRDAERMHQFNEFKDKMGEIVHGTVKRVELGNVIVDLGKAEAILRRDELIPNETFRVGDRVRAYLMDVRSEVKGPQLFLSRSHPQFLAKLFASEVPEVYDGLIEIKSVARDPGSRAKVAVWAKDNTIDARGACIGMRGVRVQAIVTELQGEKIDVVHWSSDMATFIVNAFAPTEILKIVLDEEARKAEVVVADEQLSQAIGRRGQNVRLASILTGWHIDVVNSQEEAENRQKEEQGRMELFMKALDVDDMIAHLLIQEGFTKIEEIAFANQDELSSIEGFDESLASELQARAAAYLTQKNADLQDKIKDYGIAEDLKSLEGLPLVCLEALGAKGIKTLDDFADLSADELLEIVGKDTLLEEDANRLIMKAREHWFDKDSNAQ